MEELLSIGQVAKRLGVSVDVVRSMDDRGKLKAKRTPGGHRRYVPADVERVKVRLKAGRTKPPVVPSRSRPAHRGPARSAPERWATEPDDVDVEEDVPSLKELKAEAEREAARERAAAEAKARAAAAQAEQERLEELKKYGRDLAIWSWLPTEWQARVVEDLEESVTSKRVPPSLAPRQAQQIVKSRVDAIVRQYNEAEDRRRKHEDDQRKIDWLVAYGRNYALSETIGGWDISEQDRARREVERELKKKVKADMSQGDVKDLVDDVLSQWEEDDDDDEDEDEDNEDDTEEEDEDPEW